MTDVTSILTWLVRCILHVMVVSPRLSFAWKLYCSRWKRICDGRNRHDWSDMSYQNCYVMCVKCHVCVCWMSWLCVCWMSWMRHDIAHTHHDNSCTCFFDLGNVTVLSENELELNLNLPYMHYCFLRIWVFHPVSDEIECMRGCVVWRRYSHVVLLWRRNSQSVLLWSDDVVTSSPTWLISCDSSCMGHFLLS